MQLTQAWRFAILAVIASAALVVAVIALVVGLDGDSGEDRPGTVQVLDAGTGSVSASVSGSVSGVTGSASGSVSGVTGSVSGVSGSVSGVSGSVSGSVSGTGGTTESTTATGTGAGTGERGIFIPVGQAAETEGPTKSDGYFNPTTNREIYQKIPSDYQEIASLTNLIKDGEPLPAAEIWLLYEAGTHTRIGNQSRTLRSFAAGTTPGRYFPDAVEFYGSAAFLDSPIRNAVSQRGEVAEYTDAQRRQAINKGILRVLYHWSKFYMILGGELMRSGLVDEAWAIYVGEEVDGEYPSSLAALAQSREGNFGREGTLDVPLREAMERARQAAEAGDEAAYAAAAQDVYSRFNAIFYLATVRYIGISHDDVENGDDPGTHQVEALAFYQSIQPEVAKADPAADESIIAYLTAEPDQITAASRDAVLAALNGTAAALLLNDSDLVASY